MWTAVHAVPPVLSVVVLKVVVVVVVVVQFFIWGRWGVPSRNILHVRGRESKSRTRDARYIAGRAPKT